MPIALAFMHILNLLGFVVVFPVLGSSKRLSGLDFLQAFQNDSILFVNSLRLFLLDKKV